MERRNVEIKAIDPDPERTRRLALAAEAVETAVLAQRDTYYRVAHGRLKLREQDGAEPVLIPYVRADQVSTYGLVPARPGLHEALARTLGVRVVVTKTRRLLMWEQTVRIHLDEVEGLGSFVEIEAVAAADSDLAREHDQMRRLREALAIGDERLIDSSYSDLLLAPDPRLVEMAQAVQESAYAAYSGFLVGAAVRTTAGGYFAGANVENAAYPLGNCAEASALAAMVAGEGPAARIEEVVVTATPCGGCRQRLRQFGELDARVHVLGEETYTIEQLLPRSFVL